MFPSRLRKFVHLRADQAHKSLVHLMRESLGVGNVEIGQEETLSVKAKIGGFLGVGVEVKTFPEGEVSALEFSFSYRNLLWLSLLLLIVVIGLSLILRMTLTIGVLGIVFGWGYWMNGLARRFMANVNEALPHLEREFARKALAEDRKRWELEPKDIDDLYRRLSEKHMKTWGNTNVLRYKIAEYESQGLTRNEAIRKAAEEEGIY